tara:strand:+ start:1524 stop:2522 length:999 start_codon:yes stop_codon:yes gene_type:complete
MITLKPYKKDKLLIVGLGSIGEKYRLAAKKYFDYKNVFYFSKHRKKNNLRNLKKIDNLNYIILSNPSTERINFFKSFIKKKATYIFEKPMAASAFSDKDNKEFFKLVNKNKIKIKSGYCLRLHPAVEELKKIINNNLENILKININTNSFLPSWRKKNYTKSVSAKKTSGGGVINELSHEIDLILHLFGKPKALYASFLNTKSLKINTEDVADIIFSMNNKLNLNLHLDFCSPFEKREIEIIFRNKTKIVLDLTKNFLFFSNLKKTTIKKFKIKKNFYIDAQIKEMLKISKIKNQTYWISELKDAIYVLYIIKKIRESNLNKKLVYLNSKIT